MPSLFILIPSPEVTKVQQEVKTRELTRGPALPIVLPAQ